MTPLTDMSRKEAVRDTVRKCYRPQRKVCDGSGPELCQTLTESDCTTKVSFEQLLSYIELLS